MLDLYTRVRHFSDILTLPLILYFEVKTLLGHSTFLSLLPLFYKLCVYFYLYIGDIGCSKPTLILVHENVDDDLIYIMHFNISSIICHFFSFFVCAYILLCPISYVSQIWGIMYPYPYWYHVCIHFYASYVLAMSRPL